MAGNSMQKCRRPVGVGVVAVVLLFASEMPVFAYTDPGSGALLWQLLLAGFVGAMFYLRSLVAWFRRKHKDAKD